MARRRDMPRLDVVDGLTKIKLTDEHDKRYSIGMEWRWLNLPVEKTNSNRFNGLYAFSDTYQGRSQLDEGRRPEILKHYFGGRVGQKISIEQLIERQPRNIYEIVNIVREEGVTTTREYDAAAAEQEEEEEEEYDDEEEEEEVELTGKTRHTLLNEVSIESHEIQLFEQTLNQKPLYVSFEGNPDSMQIIGEENGLFRRYKTDEDGGERLSQHYVMCIGRGFCINVDDKKDTVSYVVGQNNWPTGSAEICRFSYDSFKLGVSFDIGPSS